jgi:basic membrane lipoprotein Med (substrate-binding protein (PBP1-ABC) superfamily)
MEPTIDRAIAKVKDGSFTAEDYGQFSTMKFGGASLAPFGTFDAKIPAAVKELVSKRQQELTDGLYRVNINDAEPKSTM